MPVPKLVACIFNPSARDGRSSKKIPKILKAFDDAGIKVEQYSTDYAGHAVEIAYSLRNRDDLDVIVAIGGDGTVHEVASGMRNCKIPLGIVPQGSGDDLARAMGIPRKDISAAVDIIKNGTDHRCGAVRIEAPPANPPVHTQQNAALSHECNGSASEEGAGNIVRWSFLETDAGVTSAVSRMKSEGFFSWIKGQLKYQFLGVRAIFGFKPQKAWFQVDDEEVNVIDLQGLFVLQTCETFGGGFKASPGMHPKRPFASLVTALGLSKLQMLRVMGPLKEGTHIGMFDGKIKREQCQSFKIGACDADGNPSSSKKHEPLLYVNVDGECCLTTPASFQYHPDQLIVRGRDTIPNEGVEWK